MATKYSPISISLIFFLVIVVDSQTPATSSTQHICASIESVTKNDNCPNPKAFSIINEHNKNDTTWKLDFKVFQQASITNSLDLLNEIQRRYTNGIPCPYIRQMNVTKCCPNWTGSNCDQVETSNNTLKYDDNEPLPFATCVLWGLFHYRTFDGTQFEFTGSCNYKLGGTQAWQVNVQPIGCTNWKKCSKQLSMLFGSVNITAQGKNVIVNGVTLNSKEGIVVSGVTIERRGNYTYLTYSDGVRVKWDEATVVDLTIDASFKGSVNGLCGDYDGISTNDLNLKDGTASPSAAVFGNQWRLDRSCPEVPSLGEVCSDDDMQQKAIAACQLLLDSSDVFGECLQVVNGKQYYNACIIDYCITTTYQPKQIEEAMCNSYTALARDCTDNYIDVSWRTSSRCPKSCPNNMTYVECASNCPKTCQSLTQTISESDTCMSDCSPGCICPSGTVLDMGQNQQCVQPKQCTCYYRGNYHQPGDNITIDCNECTCSSGSWKCSKYACPRTCTVMGNGHIDTYDGKTYHLIGSCQYTLLEGTNSESSNKLRVMYTNTENINTNELVVIYYGNKVTVKGSQVIINGQPGPELPYKINDLLIRQATSILVGIEGSDFSIYFDGFRVYITLGPTFNNQTRGLCGTFNYITRDDYQTPNGLIETNLIGFADAYKISQTCTTPLQTTSCSLFPANELAARTTCQNLLKDSIFAPCAAVFDPSFYIESCAADLCADISNDYISTYTCYHLATYAHECADRGVIIDWMSKPNLSSACQTAPNPYGQCLSSDDISSSTSYSECVSACDYSCSDLDQKSSLNCQNQCLPGCACPMNTYYDVKSRSCIRAEQCPCYDISTKSYIQPGQNLFRTCTNCACIRGKFQCENPNCLSTMTCPGNQIYSNNASTCPKTCDNIVSFQDCNIYKQGCTCPSGQVLTHDGITCVPINECPCRYNQHSYSTSEQIHQGCNNCTCSAGIWSCTTVQCDSTCIASGDPHYITFDGMRYSYQGNCQYYLAKEKNNTFMILAENVPCGSTGVTCTKNIIIDYSGSSIDLQRGRNVIFNGIEIDNYESIPKIYGQVSVFKSGVFTIISTPDFLIKWDEATRIYLTVYSKHRGNMEGLCGNYNDDNADDIKTAQGIAGSIIEMANSWKTAPTCSNLQESLVDNSDPCLGHEQRRDWATTECSLIRGKSIDNPFNPCIELIDPTQLDMYYKECLFDACNCDRGGDCECLCTSLASFAEKCNSIGVPVRWRRHDRCPMQCENNKVYMACGPICPETCSGKDYFGCELSGCVEGCFCPNGLLMDETGTCVPISSCTCAYDNKYYPSGSTIVRGCEICSCTNSSFICSKLTTKECEQDCSLINEYQCSISKECIPKTWKCDNIPDCADKSDEKNCIYQCSNQTSFTCNNGQCVNMTYRCDGLPNCRDGSDEVNCTYVQPCNEFLCKKSKKCIPKTWVCDGSVDCGIDDDSDEGSDCKQEHCDLNSGRYFQCSDSQKCLPISSKCDAHKDCLDGSDERGCACTCAEQFSCQTICQCLNMSRVCDGIPDCIDKSDETNCTCTSYEYSCLGGGCINRTQLCDGIAHCSKGDDETHPDCLETTTPIPSIGVKAITEVPIPTVGEFTEPSTETIDIATVASETITPACADIAGAQWLSQYNLITFGDLDGNPTIQNPTLVCGNYMGQSSANFSTDINQNSISPSLEIRGNIASGSSINLQSGSVTSASGSIQNSSRTQFNLNGRSFIVNGGDNGASAYIDSTINTKCSEVTDDLQKFSQYLSQLTPNNDVIVPSSQSGSLNFIVNNVNQYGLAIFTLSCNNVLNNEKVQDIKIQNNVNAKTIVINLSGRTCSFEQGSMGGDWLNRLEGQSRTIWNVYEQPLNQNTRMYIKHSFMGTLLAPYYTVETSANVYGTVAVYNMIGGSALQKPALVFPPCVEPTTPTTSPGTEISSTGTETPSTSAPTQTTVSTTITPSATVTEAQTSTTTALLPTTTTMNYCIEENGMNQPLTIQPNQVTSNTSYDQTAPPGDINPTTSTTPGLNFASTNPQINITLTQPATLTLIYLPTDRPDQPTNVNKFVVEFLYPDGSTSDEFTSKIPSTSGTSTTTPSTGASSEANATLSPSVVIPPSDKSPQVDLSPNFQVPNGTIIMITILSTKGSAIPFGVTIGIIACVEVTTTTTGTTPASASSSSSPKPLISATTTLPTNAPTTTQCQIDMAQTDGIHAPSVKYSVTLDEKSNPDDLTNPSSDGVSFPSLRDTTGLFDQNNQPIYNIRLVFNPAGVSSLSSIIANETSNVLKFSVEFYSLLTPNELITYSTQSGAVPLSYNSTFTNSQASILDFPKDAPSELSGIRISILSTIKDEPPSNLKLAITACFYQPSIQTTTTPETSSSTGAPSSASTSIPTETLPSTGTLSPTETSAPTTAAAPSTTGTLSTTETLSSTETLFPTAAPLSTTTSSPASTSSPTESVSPTEIVSSTSLPSPTTSVPPSTTGASSLAETSSPTTTALSPTTTTMNYCTEENGMNQPLTIEPNQVTTNPPYDETTPPGDINPTTTTPGLNFSEPNPQINITFDQPASLTLIYLPTDRPNQPTNVNKFVALFLYPDGTREEFTSKIPSTSETTTTAPSTGAPSETTPTPSPSSVVPPSDNSPQVDLPANFQVPNGTIIMITISSTKGSAIPFGVTIGIIACVEVTTTTTSTSPASTSFSSSPIPFTSGTTTVPTSVQTTTQCRIDMAQADGIYQPSITYSGPLIDESNPDDLTNPSSNGVTFQSPSDATGLFDLNNEPIYKIILTFNPAGVNSLSSIIANETSNVLKFSVEFYSLLKPNELITYLTESGAVPFSYNSTFTNSQASILDFPDDAPSELNGIRISILSTIGNRPPNNLKFAIAGCFHPARIETTKEIPSSSSTLFPTEMVSTPVVPSAITTTLPPTTTTMNYCTEEKGMNQPLTIRPDQVASNPTSDQTKPPGDINPTTTTTPGLNFSEPNPQINITFDQPASLTVIYIPTDRPDQPTNVNEFVVVFLYPNDTTSEEFTSKIPSTSESSTTTPSIGAPSETSTIPTPSNVVPPSDKSPQIDLPRNFHVPNGTVVIINITSTKEKLPATGVCIVFIFLDVFC